MASRWADKRISNCPDNGKAPGWLASGLGVYQDYQKYSGGDFMIAAGIDVGAPVLGGSIVSIGAGVITANPIVGAVTGVAGAIAGDKVAGYIKDNYLITDEEKDKAKN